MNAVDTGGDEAAESPSGGRNRRHRMFGAGAVAGAFLAAACAGGQTPASPSSLPPASGGQAPGTTVGVTLTDFRVQLSRPGLTPGLYTFTVTNQGHTVHALEVDGPGVAGQRTPGVLRPGETANLTVTLGNGVYEFSCPVDGHKENGMDLKVTVGTAESPTPNGPPAGGGYGY
ncbi:copper-binding protein [Gandjariella thermophila]|uniref:EfeO-type cupredoxin-like domain-containing protein n=1 Tax=Gandjariella thermophila TaxID=1931992 RepID=A0A4D4JE44_9PSEU|nr:copper-binding protein [Gandjariella thermophila]GDY33914.1 hypothetical protein GTS_55470 [Gandjariella thermophila]